MRFSVNCYIVVKDSSLATRPGKLAIRLLFRSLGCVAAGLGAFALVSIPFLPPARAQRPVGERPAVRFTGGNAAEVPMELASNAVFVPVRIGGGRPSNWLLDTASPDTAVDSSAHPQASGNKTKTEAHDALRLALPGLKLIEPNLATRSFQALGPWYGLPVGGVIGDDLLTRLVAELDYARLSIELYDAGSYGHPTHMEKLSIHWTRQLPTIRAKLRLGGRTVEGNFALNTGGNSAIVVFRSFLSAQRVLPLQGKSIQAEVIDASGAGTAKLMRGEWVEFGSFYVREPTVAVTQRTDPSSPAADAGRSGNRVAGWIGGAILRKFRVVLDFPKDRIYLAPNREFVFPIGADASGATITAAGPHLDQFEVQNVRAGSPAARAGISPGDRIVLIDGEKASHFSLDQIRGLLRQSSHSYTLVVERLGRRVRIDLHLRPIL